MAHGWMDVGLTHDHGDIGVAFAPVVAALATYRNMNNGTIYVLDSFQSLEVRYPSSEPEDP